MFQVIFDLLFRPSDGEGDLFCCMRAFLKEGTDLTPYRFFFFDGCWRFSRWFSVHTGRYAILRRDLVGTIWTSSLQPTA